MTAIATSAVRDAENSGAFLAELRERFALDARILDGAEEARLTYLGAMRRAAGRRTAPWWSTSAAARPSWSSARAREVGFYASLQAGTVRHTERHLPHRPARRRTSSRRWPTTCAR